MSVIIPVDLTMAAAPLGWSGDLADLTTLVGASLSGLLDPSFLIGQTGVPGTPSNVAPLHDIGPWFYDAPQSVDSGWWFWDPTFGAYEPSEQGCAVGTIVLWGGGANVPGNWLICDGREISRTTFHKLFKAVGETWGAGDAESTFNLPPGGVFFVNAAGFVADYRVPLSPLTQPDGSTTTNGQGVGAQGGSQQSTLIAGSDVPPLQTTIFYTFPNFEPYIGQTGKTGGPTQNLQPQGYGSPTAFQDEPVTDTSGNPLGPNQVPVDIMPPYCTIYYIIKWQ